MIGYLNGRKIENGVSLIDLLAFMNGLTITYRGLVEGTRLLFPNIFKNCLVI